MRIATPLLAFVLLASASARAEDIATPAALAEAFARAMTGDHLSAFAGITESLDTPKLYALNEVLERHHCISVKSWRITAEEPDTLHVRIDASGLTRGKPQTQVVLPPAWVLGIACTGKGWRIRTAETEERRAVRLLLEDPPIDWDAALAGLPDLDVHAFVHELADQGAEHSCEEAERPIAVALEVALRNRDHAAIALCLSMASWVQTAHGSGQPGIELARQTIAAAEASGDPDVLGMARFRLGIALWLANRDDDALAVEACRALDSAGALIDSLDDPRIAMKSHYMSAYIQRLRGNLRDFVLSNEKVIELSGFYDWPEGASVARTALGDHHMVTRNFAVAFRNFESAYKDAVRGNSLPRMAEALYSLGVAQMKSGDSAAGEATFARAKPLRAFITSSAAIELEFELGFIRLQGGRLEEAEQHFLDARLSARAIAFFGIASHASAELSRIRLLRGRPREALAFAEEALADQSHVAVSTVEWSRWRALLAQGKALRALGEPARAEAVLREAVEALEVQRGSAAGDAVAAAVFFEDKVEAYRELIDVLMDGGNAPEAFAYGERMKGRALHDALVQGNVVRASLLSSEEKKEESALAKRLEELNKQALAAADDRRTLSRLRREIAEARVSQEQFELRIGMTHPAVTIDQTHVAGGVPGALRNGLVIEFVVNESRTHVFAVSRKADGAMRVVGRTIAVKREDLERLLTRLEQQIAQRDLEWARSASALYDLLLAPVERSFESTRLICIVPDGVLWRLPFQVLTRPSGEALIDRAAIFYAPSMAMLRATEGREPGKTADATLVAFGNPTVVHAARERVRAMNRDATLGELPDAESEVRAIASLYGAGRSRIYVRDAARESVFKSEVSRFRVVHLAAHGVFDDDWPMYSAIVLAAAPGESDDGLLEAREIIRLHVGADLAVLASCDTGRGRIRPGEGVIGMSWAFLVAGCPTTVVSQWLADSKATETLMVEFHRQLRAGSNPAQALQAAQRRVRADPRYSDPLYWAPFLVVGAGMNASAH